MNPDVRGYLLARRVFHTPTPHPYVGWKGEQFRRPLNGSRVKTFRGGRGGVKCPTCRATAIRLILPWGVADGAWDRARCNHCAGNVA